MIPANSDVQCNLQAAYELATPCFTAYPARLTSHVFSWTQVLVMILKLGMKFGWKWIKRGVQEGHLQPFHKKMSVERGCSKWKQGFQKKPDTPLAKTTVQTTQGLMQEERWAQNGQ